MVSRTAMIPVLSNAALGCARNHEGKDELTVNARKVLKVLRKEWEMATSDLRSECRFEKKADLTKAIDELQREDEGRPAASSLHSEIHIHLDARRSSIPIRDESKNVARRRGSRISSCYLSMCGMTLLGDLSRQFGFYRWESGRANHQLVDEKFAERLSTGVYLLSKRGGNSRNRER
jgi:hypothetical protein